MKKILKLLFVTFITMCLIPFTINAEVTDGTKVLVWTTKLADGEDSWCEWTGDIGESIKQIYDEAYEGKVTTDINLGIESKGVCTRTTLPTLDNYSLVFVMLPIDNLTEEEINNLKAFTEKGGRLVLIAENNDEAKTENGILSELAKKLGADFYIGEDSYGWDNINYVPFASERNQKSKLYSTDVEQDYIAPIIYSGQAQWVFKVEGQPWVVDEAAGKGRITVISDINFVANWYWYGPDYSKPTEFMKNLLLDSIDNMEIVSNGGNPNEDFSNSGKFVTQTDNEQVKISAIDLKDIIPLTDEEKQLIADGIDVTVRLQVSESKEDISEEDQKLINDNLNKNTLAMFLDVSLFKKVGDAEETKLSLLTNQMELSFSLDDTLINNDTTKKRVYKVIRVHDGETTLLDTKYDEQTKTLTFTTDRFSSYALVYQDINNPKTGDKIMLYTLVGLISTLSLIGTSIVINKKYNRN